MWARKFVVPVALSVVLLQASAPAARTPQPVWLRSPGHFAYCQFDLISTMWCFSTVSGRWILFAGVYDGRFEWRQDGETWVSLKGVATGREPGLVGFRREGARLLTRHSGRYSDGDETVVCSSTSTRFRCVVAGTAFWFKPDGSFSRTRG